MQGIFITIEGPDGAGKSTQAARLADYLQKQGHKVLLTREPGGTSLGEQIRTILLNPENEELDFKTEVLLYAACRAQLLKEVIIPALKEGKIVISDRFVDSSIAYQGYGRDLNLPLVTDVNRLIVGEFMPDLTILLDLPVEAGLQRIIDKEKAMDRLEQEDISFHQKVRKGFKELALKEKRIKVVSGDQSQELVFSEILNAVQKKLSQGGI